MTNCEGELGVSVFELPAGAVRPSAFLSPGWTPASGPYACLEVTDRGEGMDPETLHNAFDPFFTTKFLGRGLGLPVALGLVRANDGAMEVRTERGRGSTFRVFLPISTHAGSEHGQEH